MIWKSYPNKRGFYLGKESFLIPPPWWGRAGWGWLQLGNLIQISRCLRKRPTEAEMLLWRYLSGKQLQGLKFRRQQPIGNYIVDFVCFSRRLIVELDGGQHAVEKERDIFRDDWLRSQGFKVLRFWNNEILGNLEGVSEVIFKELWFFATLP